MVLKRFGALLGALAVVFAVLPTEVGASPRSKVEQAERLKQEIEKLDEEVSLATEEYNEAVLERKRLFKEKKDIVETIGSLNTRINSLSSHLAGRSEFMYRKGPVTLLNVFFESKSFEEWLVNWELLVKLNESDIDSINELTVLKIESVTAQRQFAHNEEQSKVQLNRLSENRSKIESVLRLRKSKLANIEAEIVSMEAAKRSFSDTYVTTTGRSQIVNIARKYLGLPYKWAAVGPNSFDCSGLTMYVYKQVGVSLPHSSRAQIYVGQRISRNQLQPGDLVFFGFPIHHVGIYIGGGKMIHAPHTGAFVRVDSLHGNYSGASRP